MKKAIRFTCVGAALGVVAALGIIAPANASSAADKEVTTVGINVTGYDEAVAAENGFEIVTYPDGSWQSVAVSPEAKAIEAAYGAAAVQSPQAAGDGAAAKTTVYGPCGSSWIAVRNSGSVHRVDTGYDVTAPVANRVNWRVQVTSLGGLPVLSWPNGPSPASWSSYGTFNTGGFGGQAYVISTSSVILINGTVCGSNSPAEGY